MSVIERDASFFRKGGLALPGRVHTECGKNADGSWYISITGGGREEQRAILTPVQAFNLAISILRVQGYALQEVKPPEGP